MLACGQAFITHHLVVILGAFDLGGFESSIGLKVTSHFATFIKHYILCFAVGIKVFEQVRGFGIAQR